MAKNTTKPVSTTAKQEKVATVDSRARTHIAIKPSSKINRFIVTGAVRGAPVDTAFLDNLDSYAAYTKSEIIVVPLKSGFSATEIELSPRLAKYRQVESLRLTSNLTIVDAEIAPQMIDPTTGLDRHVQWDTSALIPSPKQRMRCVANSNVSLPKILQGTGVCTLPRYRENRQGRIALGDHVIGAIYVETNGTVFNFRQLTATYDGSFIDLGVRVSKTVSAERADALVLGDWHTGWTCPKVKAATYKLIKQLQPRKIVLHDIFDGRSVNHHEQKNLITQIRDFEFTDVEHELKTCAEEINAILKVAPKDCELVIVKANHDEFLDRYLQAGDYLKNFRSAKYLHKLTGIMFAGGDPVKAGIEDQNGGPFPRTTWLVRDQDYKVRGWQLGSHGDLGSNGSKGSIRQTQKSTGRSITGHTHTPEILNETFSVGTSTVLKMSYNRGPSSWMNTHAVLYSNQRAQLVNIIEGSYEL